MKDYNKQDIIDFVERNSYFEYDGDAYENLEFSTRENESVYDESNTIDVIAADELRTKLRTNFKDIVVKIETVDEWVMVFVSKYKEPVDEFRYIFKKDINGQGFSQPFKSMEALIDRFGDWIEVDWNVIKTKVENIKEFPDNQFTGWHNSSPLIIKRIGEDGNTWGYNFYIIKSKKN